MFKKKSILSLISLLGILAVTAICSTSYNDAVFTPVVAEEAEPVNEELIENKPLSADQVDPNAVVTMVFTALDKNTGEIFGKLVENYKVITQADVDKTIDQIKYNYKTKVKPYGEMRGEINITFYKDCSFNFRSLNVGRVILNLQGKTFTIPSRRSWDIQDGLIINGGESGKILSNVSQSGAFELQDRSDILEVYDTEFRDFKFRRYPIFQVEGNKENDITPKIRIENCKFENCTESRYGGVIYTCEAGQIEFINCSFKKCNARYGGLGYFKKQTNYIYIEHCKFIDSTSTDGGVVYTQGNAVEFDKRIDYFGLRFKACTINNVRAIDDGGIAYINSVDTTLEFFEGNTIYGTQAENGGGIYFNKKNCKVTGLVLEKGYASKKGGAIYIDAKDIVVEDCRFIECTAKKAGNAIYSKYKFKNINNKFNDCNVPGDDGMTQSVVIEEDIIQTEQAPSQTPIWIMGSLILAAVIGATVTICLVFKKKKE